MTQGTVRKTMPNISQEVKKHDDELKTHDCY